MCVNKWEEIRREIVVLQTNKCENEKVDICLGLQLLTLSVVLNAWNDTFQHPSTVIDSQNSHKQAERGTLHLFPVTQITPSSVKREHSVHAMWAAITRGADRLSHHVQQHHKTWISQFFNIFFAIFFRCIQTDSFLSLLLYWCNCSVSHQTLFSFSLIVAVAFGQNPTPLSSQGEITLPTVISVNEKLVNSPWLFHLNYKANVDGDLQIKQQTLLFVFVTHLIYQQDGVFSPITAEKWICSVICFMMWHVL